MLLQLHALISQVSAGGPAGPETRRFANTVRQYCFVNSSMIWLGEAKPPKIASTRRGSFGSMHSCLCGLLRLFLNVPGPNDKASALGLAAAVVAWGHLKSNRKNITVQQFNLRSSLTPLRITLVFRADLPKENKYGNSCLLQISGANFNSAVLTRPKNGRFGALTCPSLQTCPEGGVLQTGLASGKDPHLSEAIKYPH